MLNMIMLGALCELPDFPIENIEIRDVIKDIFKEPNLELNCQALEMGGELIISYEN